MTLNKNKNLKKIGLLLIAIVILPVSFYTVTEINSMNDTEEMIREIYVRQMGALLFSVNQYAWDYLNDQVSKAKELITNSNAKGSDYISEANPIELLTVYDMDFKSIETEKRTADSRFKKIFLTDLPDYLRVNSNIIRNLVKNDSLGYQKIETLSEVNLPALGNEYFISLFIMHDNNQKKTIAALLLNTSLIIRNVIQPKLIEISSDRFEVNIFLNQQTSENYSFSNLQFKDVFVEKELWIFPGLSVGMRSLGQDISEVTQKRLNNSLLLIIILLVVLLSGAIFIYRNIQKEIHLSELKSDFVSNVSHELRTPLSLIRMYAETLELGRVKEESKKQAYYKNISFESERLTHLINNILNFSRIESGKKTYDLQQVSINGAVNKIIETYKAHILSNQFELDMQLSERDLIVNADISSISEAVINLIDNALKYSSEHKKIEIKTGTNESYIYLAVKDFGIGIKPQNQNKIFEKFYRESSALVHNTKGSGLGLSLVKFIMEAHQGYVGLESSPGNGSCFTLYFPNNGFEAENK